MDLESSYTPNSLTVSEEENNSPKLSLFQKEFTLSSYQDLTPGYQVLLNTSLNHPLSALPKCF